MATVSFPRMLPAALVPPAVRLVRVQALRDGEITPDVKVARFFYEPTAAELGAVFVLDDGYSREQRYSTAVDRTWMVIAVDLMAPARVEAAFVSISDDITITLDLSAGGSSGGLPAELGARVRVDGQPASRQVLVVERPSSGEWRVAGYGQTDAGGAVDLDLRVTSGEIYALALDDWGALFQANQVVTVGMVIRPTLFQGWLYRITQAGALPATEPNWWDESLAGPQQLGTARAEVIRYYRPQAHGPVPVEVL